VSATERVRELLDERGVEHYDYIAEVWWGGECSGGGGAKYTAYEQTDGLICVEIADLTPEQAIAATLGSCNCSNSERTGTCTADETDTLECVCDGLGRYGKRVTVHVMECSECGRTYEHVNGDYEFCPRCGRKVVDA